MKRRPNRLIAEKSPYLRQHAYNPVDWFAWGEEAFQKAKRENKPIFLSIGYSTCHWCHVMEKESFEDEEIAKILNEYFVPIKVDREERPDIDAFYMNVCQALTGSGGWPLTIFITPEREPFFAGTYFPKNSRFGRPGLKDILLQIKSLWETDKEDILNRAKKITQAMAASVEAMAKKSAELDERALCQAFDVLCSSYDARFGGFGKAPKFPMAHQLIFLARYFYRYEKDDALRMLDHTLSAMRMGGIWDHVGFGFHRYSTDQAWILPHFEKMLYDQALLLLAYVQGYQLLKNPLFKRTSAEIVDFLKREMRSEEGGFHSAWDADSEGEEGRFYTWSMQELKEALNEDELRFVLDVFNVQKDGNYLEEATKKKNGRNILYLGRSYEEAATLLGIEQQAFDRMLERVRRRLFAAREQRIKPIKDEKILVDWNGLAIAALSYGGKALGESGWIQMAKKAADFILDAMIDEKGMLYHRYMEKEAKYAGMLEDYAYLIWGLIELYQATLDGRYIQKAYELQMKQIEAFWDQRSGGFYQSASTSLDVPVRGKEIYDSALPSGNGVAAYNLIRLGRMLARTDLEDYGLRTMEAFSYPLMRYPPGSAFLLFALDLIVHGSKELVIVPCDNTWQEKKRHVLDPVYLPDLAIVKKDEHTKPLSDFLKQADCIAQQTTYYLCQMHACERPSTDFDQICQAILQKQRVSNT